MPLQLPTYLYARKLLSQCIGYLRLGLRAVLVASAWLALLPLGNIYVWRLHFWIVDVIVWGILGGTPPTSQSAFPPSPANATALNGTIPSAASTNSTVAPLIAASNHTSSNVTDQPLPLMPFESLAIRIFRGKQFAKVFQTFSHDTFEGQILTCAIVVLFVAIFLLREWCLQNLPQEVEALHLAQAPDNDAQEQAPRQLHRPLPNPVVPDDVLAINPLDGAEIRQWQQDNNAVAEENAHLPRPQMRHGVPDPPELLDAGNDWRLASRLEQSTAEADGDVEAAEDELQLDIDQLRSRRNKRFGLPTSTDVHLLSSEGRHDDDIVSDQVTAASTKTQGKQKRHDDHHTLDAESAVPSGSGHRLKGKDRLDDAEAEHNGDVVLERHASDEQRTKPMQDDAMSRTSSQADVSHALDEDGKGLHEKDDKDLQQQDDPNFQQQNGVSSHALNEGDADRPQQDGDSDLSDIQNNEGPADDVEENDDDDDADDRVEGNVHGGVARNADAIDLADWEDDVENGERLEDDLEGMMEAIGMRGPFVNLVTNITLMFVLCSFTLTVFVALPYMVGRMVGVGHNVVRTITLPMRLLSPVKNLLVAASTKLFAASSTPSKYTFVQVFANAPYAEAIQTSIVSLHDSLKQEVLNSLHGLETFLQALQARTRGISSYDRAFCVALGHMYWLLGLAIQNRMSHLYIRWHLRSLKAFVDQQLIVLKVLSFIILELVIFPLGCGILTDISLFPLWHNVSITTRLALASSRPLSLAFTLWSLGTLYMFGLAQFVSHTRSIVRPGLLCFVRDAGDPNFHPIRDILERRSLEQLRKIGVSAIIYSSILASTLGLCAHLISLSTDVLPLRWNVHRALTSSGLELGCIAVFLPMIVRTYLPGHWMRRSARWWWQNVAKLFRLSPYLIGGRFTEEETHTKLDSWRSFIRHYLHNIDEPRQRVHDGGYARVPADDHAVMSCPLVIRTDAEGNAISERGKEAIFAQEEAIAKMTKKPQYTVVYIPPHFRARLVSVVVTLWATLCFILLLSFLTPLLVGRGLLAAALPAQVVALHDGYAWSIGMVSILFAFSAVARTYKFYNKIRVSSNAPRRIFKHFKRFTQRAWLGLAYAILAPTLLGMIIEVYINGLTRAALRTPVMPTISLLHAWTMGLVELQLIFEIVSIRVGRRERPDVATAPLFAASLYALLNLKNGGWRRPKAWLITKHAIVPDFALMIAVLMSPLLTLALSHHVLGRPESTLAQALQVSLTFGAYTASFLMGVFKNWLWQRMESWTDVIKDEHFLISTELKNYMDQNQAEAKHTTYDAEGPIPDALLNP